MSDTTIAVASHKLYWMPQDPCYVPVWVGAATRDDKPPAGWVCDDEYDGNISEKNASYCELTALHWLWKNARTPYVGLTHYRRHFARGPFGSAKDRIAREQDFVKRLHKAPLILPNPRNYVIETNYSQYAHAHHAEDLDCTRDVLAERYPHIASAWDASMKRTVGHRFNMLVARRDVMDEWCMFLFDVLAELERRVDISNYSTYDQRFYGFMSERLLDPWVEANQIPYVELPVANLESQHWPKKAAAFVRRKVRGTRGGNS